MSGHPSSLGLCFGLLFGLGHCLGLSLRLTVRPGWVEVLLGLSSLVLVKCSSLKTTGSRPWSITCYLGGLRDHIFRQDWLPADRPIQTSWIRRKHIDGSHPSSLVLRCAPQLTKSHRSAARTHRQDAVPHSPWPSVLFASHGACTAGRTNPRWAPAEHRDAAFHGNILSYDPGQKGRFEQAKSFKIIQGPGLF